MSNRRINYIVDYQNGKIEVNYLSGYIRQITENKLTKSQLEFMENSRKNNKVEINVGTIPARYTYR